MPTVVRQDLDNSSAKLTVQISRDELKPKLDSELKRFRQRASIKGFRQGQAPMDFVKKLYGTSIFVDTFNDLVSKELFDYIKESKLDILGQPLPSDDQKKYTFKINDPEPEYTVDYEVGFVPPFELKGLDSSETFERLTISNLDELASEDLQYARRRMGKRTNPTEDIQDNDIVKIEATELDGDKPKEGGVQTTITILMKTVKDEAIKSELLSKKTGDTIRFNPREIEKHEDDKMYRKYILSLDEKDTRTVGDLFEGVIGEVSRTGDAELDEEFYKGYFGGGVTNQDEAIEQLKKGIQQFYDTRSEALLMRSFQQRLLELNPVELPDQFLHKWLIASNEGKLSPESVQAEYPAFAEDLRWSLITSKINEQFGLEVTDDDVFQDYAARVRNYFQVDLPDNIIAESVDRLMKDEKDVEKTRKNLETDKMFKAILGKVATIDKAVSSEEFHKILESATNQGRQQQIEG